jgi:Glycosyl hydrolase family 3 N terminal domain.
LVVDQSLRNDWGFNGYVVSDCGGPSLLVSAMKYVKTKEAAATLQSKQDLISSVAMMYICNLF